MRGSVRILNRIMTVTGQGLEYGAVQRHAEILMKDTCFDESSKGVVTLGTASTSDGGQSYELGNMEGKVYLERWRREATT
jgi:hypothetical protein